MKIKEFCEKYGVEKRRVDYLTNLGLISCEQDEDNRYREYGSEAEREIKKYLIAIAVGETDVKSIKLFMEVFNNWKDSYLKFIEKRIYEERLKTVQKYDYALQYLQEMASGD